MSESNLERLSRLEAEATPGPWSKQNGDIFVSDTDGDDRVICGMGRSSGFRSSSYEPIQPSKPEGAANTQLIVSARNALPHLLRIAAAAKELDKSCSGGCVPSPYEVTKLLQALAAFEAAKIGGGE